MAFYLPSTSKKIQHGPLVGAWIYMIWKDDPQLEVHKQYISFGEYDEETETDGFGVPDLNVFYYFDKLEDILNVMMDSTRSEFRIQKYEPVYAEITS